jgi:3'(2'), 5'-bisphosphate nucleotidase
VTDSELLELAERIAIDAGAEILSVYEASGDIEVNFKQDNSPLTQADQRAHNLIVRQLQQVTPDIPVLSEESDAIDYAQRRSWTRYWLVDPLDGTKEFVKRNGEFTVNIALIEQGLPILGVVHVPVTHTTYSGLVGSGATKINADGERSAIETSKIQPGQKRLMVVASRSHRDADTDLLIEKLRDRFSDVQLVSMGSSLKICLVAEGQADLYPRLAPTCEWDTAAAHGVLAAAGGDIVNTGFEKLTYNAKAELLNPFFIAIADTSFNWQEILLPD